MSSVTFPTEYGGSGQTITDDANPSTGLLNGGHRQRFVPGLEGTVDMAQWTKLKADETKADRIQTGEDRNATNTAKNQAESASVTAVNSMNTAISAADSAEASAIEAAQNASAIYQSVSSGLSETTDGQYFKVVEQGYLQLYRNDNGTAFPEFRLASQDELERLNTRLDPLLTSLLF